MTILTTLAAATMVVASPVGPSLEPLPPPMEQVIDKSLEAKINAPKCYVPSRLFNIAGQALDIGTTIYAVEKLGYTEVGPFAAPIIGKNPKPWEVIAFKAVPFVAIDVLAKELLGSKKPTNACVTHVTYGGIAWFAGIHNLVKIIK